MSIRIMTSVWQSSPYSGDRLLIHLALADFANDEGECWPSQATIARKARCSVRHVRTTILAMVADGEIEITEQRLGRRARTAYLMKRGTQFLSPDECGTPQQEKRKTSASDTSYKNRHEPSHSAEQFDQFWKIYPRKVAKGAARRAWDRVMSSPSAPPLSALLDAASSYAQTQTDPRYICHPATWLSQERWSDEQGKPTAAQPIRESDEERRALSLAGAFRLSGRSREALAESIAAFPTEVQARAFDLYDR
jgi:hypothetical protein